MSLKRPYWLPWKTTIGDAVPAWDLVSVDGVRSRIDDVVGQPLVIAIVSDPFHPDAQGVLRQLSERFDAFTQLGAYTIAIAKLTKMQAESMRGLPSLRIPLLNDENGEVSAAFRGSFQESSPDAANETIRVFVVNANARIGWISTQIHFLASIADEVANYLRRQIARDPTTKAIVHAPVLLLENVIDRMSCRALIDHWREDNHESGFMRDIGDKTVGHIDYGHKRRRDRFLKGGPVRNQLNNVMIHRVFPEIRKSFNFLATRIEDFRIACYDAERGGFFKPHRDNTTQATSHRVWAMSLNLNAEEYEGGFLRFPEFGPKLYKPGTGDAVVFSCKLLHEATPVTKGNRFVLLSFFYGEREAQIREEIAKRLGDSYRAGQIAT